MLVIVTAGEEGWQSLTRPQHAHSECLRSFHGPVRDFTPLLLPLIYISYSDKTKSFSPSIHYFFFPTSLPSGFLGSVRFHLGPRTLKEGWGNTTGSHKWSGSYSGQWGQWILMHACISRLRAFQGRTNGLGKKRGVRSVGVPEASRETLKTFAQSRVLT